MGFIFQKSTDTHFSSACSGMSDNILRQSSLTDSIDAGAAHRLNTDGGATHQSPRVAAWGLCDSIDAGAALRLYTDGGATHQSPRVAAWGLCVILEYPSGRFELVGTANGLVHTDAGHGEFLGAKLDTNNVAELSAIMWAAAWLLNIPGLGHAEIMYDSQYAADAVNGVVSAVFVLTTRSLSSPQP